MSRRVPLARDVYGRNDDEDFENQPLFQGRKTKATRVVSRHIDEVEFHDSCGAPKAYCRCEVKEAKLAEALMSDSLQESAIARTAPWMFDTKVRVA